MNRNYGRQIGERLILLRDCLIANTDNKPISKQIIHFLPIF